ncbi:bestrophin [Haematobacter missouriensis]|nr:bestrophin [Haematobacter missouriensis]
MIVRDRPSALRLFFVMKGSIVQRIWPQLLSVALLSAFVVAAHRWLPGWVPGMNPAPFTLIGIALSIFLGFRNGASYDRWWEARKLWGQIIQTARDIARQTALLTETAPEARRDILHAIIGFAHAGARGLRGETPDPSADALLTRASLTVARSLRAGVLEPVEVLALNESLGRLSQGMVGCERLANTPLPFAYALLLHRTAYIFCFLLPFGFADSLGWATPLAVALMAYTFFGLDALADELEEPFGLMPNDLPIASYATGIEITLRRELGETELPPAPRPDDYVLT